MTSNAVTAESPDQVEQLVLAAVNAVESGTRDDISGAIEALYPIETGDVLAELFLLVDDITTGVEMSSLLEATRIKLPPNSPEMLKAVEERDLDRLLSAVGSDELTKAFSSLLVLVASIKDARTRL